MRIVHVKNYETVSKFVKGTVCIETVDAFFIGDDVAALCVASPLQQIKATSLGL